MSSPAHVNRQVFLLGRSCTVVVCVLVAYIYTHLHASRTLPQPRESSVKYDQFDGLTCWVVQLHVWNI